MKRRRAIQCEGPRRNGLVASREEKWYDERRHKEIRGRREEGEENHSNPNAPMSPMSCVCVNGGDGGKKEDGSVVRSGRKFGCSLRKASNVI